MGDRVLLLKKDKNRLLAVIQEAGLAPSLFVTEEKEISSNWYFTMALRDSPILFAVRADNDSFGRFWCRYSSFRVNFPLDGSSWSPNWEDLALRFKGWLNDVAKAYLDDINAPDLWRMLEETRSHTKNGSGTQVDFEPFSDEEKVQVRLALDDFRLLIVKNFSPNKEELESIDTRLKYLSDAVDKQNKFNWRGIAINTVIAISIALSLGPEQGHQLFQLFQQVFSNIIYLLQ